MLPVFSNFLPADSEMAAYVDGVRAPFVDQLTRVIASTEVTLYRRGNFGGTFDQVILDALLKVRGADIAFSPGFRWGTSLLPGDSITYEHVMDQTAITYAKSTLNEMTGEMIHQLLEGIADNLFNPDTYYQIGRGYGARRWVDLYDRPGSNDWPANFAAGARRKAARCSEDLPGGRLGQCQSAAG